MSFVCKLSLVLLSYLKFLSRLVLLAAEFSIDKVLPRPPFLFVFLVLVASIVLLLKPPMRV